jgi:hypothetical protein
MKMCGVDFSMHNLNGKCWRVTFVHNPAAFKTDELKLFMRVFRIPKSDC